MRDDDALARLAARRAKQPFVVLLRQRHATRSAAAVRIVGVIVGAAADAKTQRFRDPQIVRGRELVVVGVIDLERVETGLRRSRGSHSSCLTRTGCASEAIPPAAWMCANTSSGDAPMRGTNAGRPRDSQRLKASATLGTWPPATSARAIQGRPAALDESVSAGRQNRVGVQRDAVRGEPGDHLADAVDAPLPLIGEKRQQRRRMGLDEISEHVDIGAVDHRRHFDSGHKRDLRAGAGVRRQPRSRQPCRDRSRASTRTPAAAARATSSSGVQRPSDAVVWVWRSINARHARGARFPARRTDSRSRSARYSRDEQVPVGAFFFGEFEKDLLAFRILEPLAVFLEELVRVALAPNADEQRLQIVHPGAQLLGALGENAVGGTFEEQKGRPRLEQRVLGRQLVISPFECSEMLFFFTGELLEDAAAAGIGRERGGPRVELQSAPLGGNRDAQRVSRKHQLGRGSVHRRGTRPGAALLTGPEHLNDGLRRLEIAGGGNLLDERLDIRAQKFGRTVAHVADEMKMSGMPVGRLESRTSLAEIDLAGDAGVHHPLQRAVDGGATDPRVFLANKIAEIVRAQMALLTQKHIEDAVAFAGTLAAGRAQAGEIQGRVSRR